MACALPSGLAAHNAQHSALNRVEVGALSQFENDGAVDFKISPEVEQPADESPFSIALPQHLEWNAKASRRFQALAIKEAFGKITPQERREIETLDALRETELAPSSADEIMQGLEAKRQTDALIEALKGYVQFFDSRERPKNSPARKAKAPTQAS